MAGSMTFKEIKQDLREKINRAASKTYMDADRTIELSYDIFYSQGKPKFYSAGTGQRTYTLPNSKYLKMVSGLDSVYLEAGYEGNYISYNTGTFDGGEVLGATMTGTYGVLGDPSYDDIAFEDIIRYAHKNFEQEFK